MASAADAHASQSNKMPRCVSWPGRNGATTKSIRGKYTTMTNYLIDDRPIMFLPQLAKALGSCERAIVLQQIHWLSRQPNSGLWQDGLHWIWGTYEAWCRDYFTMWSPHTLAKIIRKLEDSGVLISAQLRARDHDRTKFYRIDYDALHSILPDQVVSEPPAPVASIAPDKVDSINRTKTPTENTPQNEKRPPRAQQQKNSYDPVDYGYILPE